MNQLFFTFTEKLVGGVNLCFALGDVPFSSVAELLIFDAPFKADDSGPIVFGIIVVTGLILGWGIFEVSRPELFDNGRCADKTFDGINAGAEDVGDGLGPSWFWGIGLDWSEIPLTDLDGDKGELGVDVGWVWKDYFSWFM